MVSLSIPSACIFTISLLEVGAATALCSLANCTNRSAVALAKPSAGAIAMMARLPSLPKATETISATQTRSVASSTRVSVDVDCTWLAYRLPMLSCEV